MAPLSGIRVLDLTNVLAGPYCCHLLHVMGAEVVKVEAPSGDLARRLGNAPALNGIGMGASFLAQNAGKRSVVIDLKSGDGLARFHRLLATADVLVENFRPGVMDRLGIGAATLRERHPTLVYCAISGFGQDGPLAGRPAYDQIVQGMSGAMSVTGDPGPMRAGWPVSDTMGGTVAAFAVAAALNQRPRGTTIDVSMLEATLASMGWVVSNHLLNGETPAAHGNENPTSSPSGVLRCGDAPITLAANEERQWRALIGVLGLDHLADDPRFATRDARKARRPEVWAALEAASTGWTAADLVDALTSAGVPCGPILTVPEGLDHARPGFLAPQEVPGHGEATLVTAPFRLDGARPRPDGPPPTLGQHDADYP